MIVKITDVARLQYQSIYDYILARFGYKIAEEFDQKVLELIIYLENFPKIGIPQASRKNLYGIHLSTQTRVFYILEDKNIVIVAFSDNRKQIKISL